MSGCNMLEKAATCPAATCSKKRQHVRLQHARTGCNMSGYNMLEQAAAFCYNRHFYGLLDGIVIMLMSLLSWIVYAVRNIAYKFEALLLTSKKLFKRCPLQR
jgi:hypothetical protein